jgi:hypothetical protein
MSNSLGDRGKAGNRNQNCAENQCRVQEIARRFYAFQKAIGDWLLDIDH